MVSTGLVCWLPVPGRLFTVCLLVFVLIGAGQGEEQPNSFPRPAPTTQLRDTTPTIFDLPVIDLHGILCIERLTTASPLA